MTQEELGFVKLEWTCPNCSSRNPGPQKTCSGCGNAQPENVEFHLPERQELLTDEKEKEAASRGPDIHCAFCGARNPAGSSSCGQCGADLGEGKVRTAGQVVGAFRSGPEEMKNCPTCGAPNPDTALRCGKCGAPLKAPPALAAVPPQSAPGRGAKKGLAIGCIVALVVVFLIAACAGIYFLFFASSGSVEGRVQSLNWKTVVVVEALKPVTKSAWKNEVPQNVQIGSCKFEYSNTDKVKPAQPEVRATEVCGTPYVKSSGSGYGQTVRDCEYRVYREKCEYTVREWTRVDQAQLQGNDAAPRFASPALQAEQRLGARTATYTVVFETANGVKNHTTEDLATFQKYPVGSRWNLRLNALGGITGIEPLR